MASKPACASAIAAADKDSELLARLQQEVARLRIRLVQVMGLRNERELALLEWFGLTPSQARIAGDLLEAQGAVVPHETLTCSTARKSSTSSVQVHVFAVREAMEQGAILTVRGVGYSMTVVGLRECEMVLNDWEMTR